jgi:hypothetical protein
LQSEQKLHRAPEVRCGEEEIVNATMDPVRTDAGGVAADPWLGFTGGCYCITRPASGRVMALANGRSAR